MKEPRIYYGDLRLWRTGRYIEAKRPRGGMQVYEGIDSKDALVLPTSPNYNTELECHTLFDPTADANGDFTRFSLQSIVDAMSEALVARSAARAPVCWIEDSSDTTVNRSISAVAGGLLTVGSNSFANNDWVLVRRLGVGLWTLSQVSGRTATQITVTAAHPITTSDTVMLVHQFWKNMVFDSNQGIGVGKDGGHFSDDVTYPFKGTCPAAYRYSRLTVNLDA